MEHTPTRPAWTCRTCGQEWPCQTRRTALLAEYAGEPSATAMFLAVTLTDAADDLDEPAGRLVDRFLGWLRPAAVAR